MTIDLDHLWTPHRTILRYALEQLWQPTKQRGPAHGGMGSIVTAKYVSREAEIPLGVVPSFMEWMGKGPPRLLDFPGLGVVRGWVFDEHPHLTEVDALSYEMEGLLRDGRIPRKGLDPKAVAEAVNLWPRKIGPRKAGRALTILVSRLGGEKRNRAYHFPDDLPPKTDPVPCELRYSQTRPPTQEHHDLEKDLLDLLESARVVPVPIAGHRKALTAAMFEEHLPDVSKIKIGRALRLLASDRDGVKGTFRDPEHGPRKGWIFEEDRV